MTDVKKTVASVKSSPSKKGETCKNPLCRSNRFHMCMILTFISQLKQTNGKVQSSPVTSVQISPIQFKTSILNKERLKRSYHSPDFLHDVEISPSRYEIMKNKVEKVDKTLCFLMYISNNQGPIIYLVMILSALTSLMSLKRLL